MNLTKTPTSLSAKFTEGYYLYWVYAFDGKSKQCFEVKQDGTEKQACVVV